MRENMLDRLGLWPQQTDDGSTDTDDAIHTSHEFFALIRPGVHPVESRSTSHRERATRTLPADMRVIVDSRGDAEPVGTPATTLLTISGQLRAATMHFA